MSTTRDPRSRWSDDDGDIVTPSTARTTDWALGGGYNLSVDRAWWDRVCAVFPAARDAVIAEREFSCRAVWWLADHGIRQFLDLTSGSAVQPGSVHEAVGCPHVRVAYIDSDPALVGVARDIVACIPHAVAVHGDIREPHSVLNHPEVNQMLDLAEPVAVLMAGTLSQLADDDDPAGLIAAIDAATVPGSYLVLSQAGPHLAPGGTRRQQALLELYRQTRTPLTVRTPDQIRTMLAGTRFRLVDPGIVTVTAWHPEPDLEQRDAPTVLAAVAGKPHIARAPGPYHARSSSVHSLGSPGRDLTDSLGRRGHRARANQEDPPASGG